MSEYQSGDNGHVADAGALPGDDSSAENAPPLGDTSEYEAEVNPDTGEPNPVPYARFKEGREELKEMRHKLEDMQGDFDSHRNLIEQQRAQIEHYHDLANQYQSQQQQQKKQQDEAFEEDDPYADPMDKRLRNLERLIEGSSKSSSDRVSQLEQQLEEQKQRQQSVSLEREYNGRVEQAMVKYPRASRNDVEADMFRSKKVDKRTVEHFAKRSQEKEDEKFRSRLRTEGYRAPAKPLMPAGVAGATKRDFGDNLEEAHLAALESLVGTNH